MDNSHIKSQGMFLYSAVSSPLDRSKRFTLFLPWQTCSFRHQLGLSWEHKLRNDYSLTWPPLPIDRYMYSFLQVVKLKNKLYKTVIRPTLIYGGECWPLHRAEQQRMHTTKMKMLRWIQGKTRNDRIRNEKFRSDAMVKPITTCHPETPFVVGPCDEKR